jgi:predicted N-acetyltransferase YhbS
VSGWPPSIRVISDWRGREDEIAELFRRTFTASEGAEEGAAVGGLARDLLATTPEEDLRVFAAEHEKALGGCILFTRLAYPNDARTVFLLSPVAVAPEVQGRGVGQRLISDALDALRAEGAEVAVTYGDLRFYGRVGFVPVTAEQVAPPQPLGQPEGWLAQSLTEAPLAPLKGPARCAPGLDDPAYW